MKNIAYLAIVLLLITNTVSALEKRDCTGLKKLSKAYLTCKSGNFKAGIVNTGSQIKKNTVGKVKIKKTKNGETTASKISKSTKEKTQGIKNKLNKIFSGTTKQYPKYIKDKKEMKSEEYTEYNQYVSNYKYINDRKEETYKCIVM